MDSFGDHFRRHIHRSVSENHIRRRLGDTHAQSVETTYEADTDRPAGLMQVMETADYKAEIKYLRKPDTGEPFDIPWHAKIYGPDPLAGGRFGVVWSGSYGHREEAVNKAGQQLNRYQDRLDRRNQMDGVERRTAETDEVLGYAVYNPDTTDFVRSGFFGQILYPTREGATEEAESDEYVVEVTRVEKRNVRP